MINKVHGYSCYVECSPLLVFDDHSEDDHNHNNGSLLVHGKDLDWTLYGTLMLRSYWFNTNDFRGSGRSTKAALSHLFLPCFGKKSGSFGHPDWIDME